MPLRASVRTLQTLPDGAWETIFAVMTAWFAYRVLRDAQVSGLRALAGGHWAPHLIHAGAMLYMFLALSAPAAHGSGGVSGMSGMGTLELPFLSRDTHRPASARTQEDRAGQPMIRGPATPADYPRVWQLAGWMEGRRHDEADRAGWAGR